MRYLFKYDVTMYDRARIGMRDGRSRFIDDGFGNDDCEFYDYQWRTPQRKRGLFFKRYSILVVR